MSHDPLAGETGRILKFEPRHRRWFPMHWPDPPGLDSVDDHPRTEDDDYPHRMRMNVAALAVLVLLGTCGLWLADKMSELRAAQECLTMGARGACAAIPVPDHPH
jgi:hypothetical protein